MVFYSKSHETALLVRVGYQHTTVHNFVARRIIKRYSLHTVSHSSTVKYLDLDRTLPQASSAYIDLATSADDYAKGNRHRFYVVENCRFDMLVGSKSSSLWT